MTTTCDRALAGHPGVATPGARRAAMMPGPRRLPLLAALAVLAGASVLGCGRRAEGGAKAEPAGPLAVKTAAVETRALSQTVDLTGEVVAVSAVTASVTVEGPISFCPWREGDQVKAAGERLIAIDRPAYGAEVEAGRAALGLAEAKLADLLAGARPEEIVQGEEAIRKLEEAAAFAKVDLERIAALVERKGLPGESMERAKVTLVDQQSQLETARQRLAMLRAGPTATEVAVGRAAVEEARARLRLAEARVAECTVRAPFAGIVSRVHVRPGDMAAPRAPLLEMFDPSSLVIRIAVPEAEALALREGLEARIRFDAAPDRTLPGKVSRVYPDLDRRMRTRTVEVVSAEPAALMPGQFARVRLTLRTVPNAAVVPLEALLKLPGGESIVFVARDGKVRRTEVKTGLVDAGVVQVVEGPAPGQQVVVGSLARLKDGMRVAAPPAVARPARTPASGEARP